MHAERIADDDPRWVWRLEWDEITPRIVVGSCPRSAADLERLRAQAGAGAVLSLQHDQCHVQHGIDYPALCRHGASIGLAMARCAIRDFDPADARRHLASAVRSLHALLMVHARVYVHCTAGMGRSPLTVLGYLVFIEGMALGEALELIRSKRPITCPNLEALLGCRADLVAQRRRAIARRAAQLRLEDAGLARAELELRAEHEVLRATLSA